MAKNGRSGAQEEALRRTFGDMEVVDAKDDLRIPLIASDLEGAERKNPERCALARAAIREFDSSAAVFFQTVAYVDLIDETGVRRVERFVVTPTARRVIEEFDRGEAVSAGGRWLVLKAPQPSQTLDRQYKNYRKRRAAMRRGEYTPQDRSDRRPTLRSAPRDLEVRNGKGQWQMIQARKADQA